MSCRTQRQSRVVPQLNLWKRLGANRPHSGQLGCCAVCLSGQTRPVKGLRALLVRFLWMAGASPDEVGSTKTIMNCQCFIDRPNTLQIHYD